MRLFWRCVFLCGMFSADCLWGMREFHDEDEIEEKKEIKINTRSLKEIIALSSMDQNEVFSYKNMLLLGELEKKYKINRGVLFDIEEQQSGFEWQDEVKKIIDEFSLSDELWDRFLKIIKISYEKNNLFFLSECNKDICGMRRDNVLWNSIGFRHVVECYVAQKINTILDNNHNSAIVASLGAGGLNSDRIILQEVLKSCPTARIIIQVIDILYAPYCSAVDTYKMEYFERNENLIEHAGKIINNWPVLQLFAMFQAFLRYFFYHYPKATIDLMVFPHTKAYKEYVQKNDCKTPDFLCGMDLNSEQQKEFLKDYFGLYEMLQDGYKDVQGFACYHNITNYGFLVDQYTVHIDGKEAPFLYVPQADEKRKIFRNLLLRAGFYKERRMGCDCLIL